MSDNKFYCPFRLDINQVRKWTNTGLLDRCETIVDKMRESVRLELWAQSILQRNVGVKKSLEREMVKKYNLSNYIPKWESSLFQERILRFGIEAKNHNPFDPRDAECINAIRQSFIEDMIQFITQHPEMSFGDTCKWLSAIYKN